jgi:hypothetical protein
MLLSKDLKNRLISVWKEYSVQDLAKLFECTNEDIHNFGKQNSLSSKRGKYWSAKEIDYILDNYNKVGLYDLCAYCKCSEGALYNKVKELGLGSKKRVHH